jgi:predicted lipid-binding transport protein (Tim44 family)
MQEVRWSRQAVAAGQRAAPLSRGPGSRNVAIAPSPADAGGIFTYIDRIVASKAAGAALQVLELIILAALAAVVLFQLYAVLGRKVGRGSEDLPPSVGANAEPARLAQPAIEGALPVNDLAAMKARDPSFDVAQFLQGARKAYQMIVTAFASGDRAALKPLLSSEVMDGFESAIREREAQGRTESVDFLQAPRADFEGVSLSGDLAKASVRFLAEFRNRSTGSDGEAVDDRRTAEVWTFERNLKSRNPNWTLIHVDAAEA